MFYAMITRDNYQEFFLLYVDNELSAADRSMVEEWVVANPDRQEEWESLLSCRILPEEELVFRDKQSLLRVAGDIKESNYQDYLLSYIDNQLNDKDRQMVETFIGLFPSKRLELEQLRQTVSPPDKTIVFPDKDSLYKNEDHRRVIIFYRLLAGAAAVLLAAVALLILQRHSANQPTLVKNIKVEPARPNTSTQINKKDPSPVTPAATAPLYPTETKDTVRGIAKKKVIRSLPVQTPAQHTDNTAPEKQESGTIDQMAVVLPEHDPAGEKRTETLPEANAPLIRTTGTTAAAQQVRIPKELSSFATQALLEEDNEKTIASLPEPTSPGKNKLRGLFRKVARTFGKTADRDGEGKREVLISAFQVAVD
ncbi:MAG TPA: hypothetical protein VL727_03200 [Puia sp.]|nr:hypothetical protein [Puia sp.]